MRYDASRKCISCDVLCDLFAVTGEQYVNFLPTRCAVAVCLDPFRGVMEVIFYSLFCLRVQFSVSNWALVEMAVNSCWLLTGLAADHHVLPYTAFYSVDCWF